MTTYTQVFGSDALPASDAGYSAVALSAATDLFWPEDASGDGPFATDFLEVTPSGAGLTLDLPDARDVGEGRSVMVFNAGASSFDVRDSAAGALATVAAGEAKCFVLTDNATAAGAWRVFTMGTGTSSADASALAGAGLAVISSQLAQRRGVSLQGGSATATASDRAKLFVFNGTTATLSLPAVGGLSNGYFVAALNLGSGNLTIDPDGAETLDGAASKTLAPTESCVLVTDGSAWYSTGYGRSTTFSFSQATVNMASATKTLSSSDVAGKMIAFTGNPGAAATVTVPSVQAVYYVKVAYSASHDTTFTTGGGTTVVVGNNQQAILYCNGVDVLNAYTATVSGTVQLNDGTSAAPAMSFASETNTGLYRSGAGDAAVAVLGSAVAHFTATGINSAALGATTPAAGAFTTLSASGTATFSGLLKPTFGFKPPHQLSSANLVTNGDGQIAQRIGAGSVVASASSRTYGVDRWFAVTTGGGQLTLARADVSSGDAGVGSSWGMSITVSTADASATATDVYTYSHPIEGRDARRLYWGTANAKRVVLSFRCAVSASISGATVGGTITNSPGTRSYPFTFVPTTTYQTFSISIPGCTDGTWASDASEGVMLRFDLGCGSNFRAASQGACSTGDATQSAGTWQVGNYLGPTGASNTIATLNAQIVIKDVQLQEGTYPTPYEVAEYGEALERCRRYYRKTFAADTAPATNVGLDSGELNWSLLGAGVVSGGYWGFGSPMRAAPTVTTYNPAAANDQARNRTTSADCASTGVVNAGIYGVFLFATADGGASAGNTAALHAVADAEYN